MHATFLTMQGVLEGLSINSAAVSRGGKEVIRDLHPRVFPKGLGLKTLQPEELLMVRVPIVRIRDGRIEGYQRPFKPAKARAIAKWMAANKEEYLETLPVVEISSTDGDPFATDGEHRIAAAIIARLPLRAVITKRSVEQARRLFTLQGKASRVPRNLLIFDSDGPIEEYIQDAVTDDTHPWSILITASTDGSSKTKMSATSAFGMLTIFLTGKSAFPARQVGNPVDPSIFSKDDADLLATLMSSFGNRQTNKLAWSAISLRAIAITARQVFKDREPLPEDKNRWIRRMPGFQFHKYPYITSAPDLANQMISLWNRGLPDDRKASRVD